MVDDPFERRPQAADKSDVIATKPCPKCGVLHPAEPGVVDWCEACGWNVQPAVEQLPRGRVESLYARAGRHAGERLWQSLAAAPDRRHTRLVTAAAYAYSVVVYAVLGGLLVAGGWLLATQWRNPFADVVAVVMLGVAAVARPRPVAAPTEVVARDAAPELHDLVERVGEALGARSVDGIALSLEFNASYRRSGWRGRRYLTLGLPLWSILEPGERVALIGHELGHDVNGDPVRSLIVRSALNSLIELHALFAPQGYVVAPSAMGSAVGIAAMLANAVMRLLGHVFRPPVALFRMIVWRESQRAEFEADRLAARAGGSEATIGLIEKLQLGDTVRNVVAAAAVQDPRSNVLDRIRDRVSAMPERERARHRAAMLLQNARFDATHPPTVHRVELLRRLPPTPPTVWASAAQHAAIDTELARFEPEASAHLIDQARDRLARRSGRV
jgi:Zn-dependent protease with chaperone function